MKVLLSGARRTDDVGRVHEAIDRSLELITDGIANLRALITELRPAALDELGVQPALEALAARVSAQTDVQVNLDVDLGSEQGRAAERHTAELELVVYRVVQEALTNVVKHAGARSVQVRVADVGDTIAIDVQDDGRGLDEAKPNEGFGLVGMRERVESLGGTLTIGPGAAGGTRVTARMPVRRRLTEPTPA